MRGVARLREQKERPKLVKKRKLLSRHKMGAVKDGGIKGGGGGRFLPMSKKAKQVARQPEESWEQHFGVKKWVLAGQIHD